MKLYERKARFSESTARKFTLTDFISQEVFEKSVVEVLEDIVVYTIDGLDEYAPDEALEDALINIKDLYAEDDFNYQLANHNIIQKLTISKLKQLCKAYDIKFDI